jgi:hypothetical protein
MESRSDLIPMTLLAILIWSEFAGGEGTLEQYRIGWNRPAIPSDPILFVLASGGAFAQGESASSISRRIGDSSR